MFSLLNKRQQKQQQHIQNVSLTRKRIANSIENPHRLFSLAKRMAQVSVLNVTSLQTSGRSTPEVKKISVSHASRSNIQVESMTFPSASYNGL